MKNFRRRYSRCPVSVADRRQIAETTGWSFRVVTAWCNGDHVSPPAAMALAYTARELRINMEGTSCKEKS